MCIFYYKVCVFAIACALRLGVTLVGEFFYWALLTPLRDPLSGTGSTPMNGAPTRP